MLDYSCNVGSIWFLGSNISTCFILFYLSYKYIPYSVNVWQNWFTKVLPKSLANGCTIKLLHNKVLNMHVTSSSYVHASVHLNYYYSHIVNHDVCKIVNRARSNIRFSFAFRVSFYTFMDVSFSEGKENLARSASGLALDMNLLEMLKFQWF